MVPPSAAALYSLWPACDLQSMRLSVQRPQRDALFPVDHEGGAAGRGPGTAECLETRVAQVPFPVQRAADEGPAGDEHCFGHLLNHHQRPQHRSEYRQGTTGGKRGLRVSRIILILRGYNKCNSLCKFLHLHFTVPHCVTVSSTVKSHNCINTYI